MTSSIRNIYVAVVDDDESVRRSLGRLLRTAGLQPIPYSSAEAFLGDLKHPQFDCLVLDIRLGAMSGIELNKQLAGAGSRVPVIFITAHDDPETRQRALDSGCAAYFRKSDSGVEVLDGIRHAIAGTQSVLPKPGSLPRNAGQES